MIVQDEKTILRKIKLGPPPPKAPGRTVSASWSTESQVKEYRRLKGIRTGSTTETDDDERTESEDPPAKKARRGRQRSLSRLETDIPDISGVMEPRPERAKPPPKTPNQEKTFVIDPAEGDQCLTVPT